MTDDKWREIVSIATAKAKEMARESAVAKEKPECIKLDDERRQQIELIRKSLELYRESVPDSAIRKMIDRLLEQHAILVNPSDRYYRMRHNILILKYIVNQQMNDKEIKKRLGMGIKGHGNVGFENQLEKGIREMAALFFRDWELWDMPSPKKSGGKGQCHDVGVKR